jgi:hemerythrin-like domain-containing protein
MQPIGPLMIEHRLIERLLTLMEREFKRIKDNTEVDPEFAFVDPGFIDTAVDFIRTYADRCHHGKEEDLLFKALAEKDLAPEHRQTMEELIQEHAYARELTAGLIKAKEAYLLEKPGALDDLMGNLGKLVEFYPPHIEKEDKHFFIPCMTYFTDAERAGLLAAMYEFDRRLIHEKYRGIVESMEQRRGCKSCH